MVCGVVADGFCSSAGVDGAVECGAAEVAWLDGVEAASKDAAPFVPQALSVRAHRSGSTGEAHRARERRFRSTDFWVLMGGSSFLWGERGRWDAMSEAREDDSGNRSHDT